MSKRVDSLLYESDNDYFDLKQFKDELEGMEFKIDTTWETENDSDINSEESAIIYKSKRSSKHQSNGDIASCDISSNLLDEWKNKEETLENEKRKEPEDFENEMNDNEKREEPADFEGAIDASGFGLFNILLLLVTVLAAGATVFETAGISYILPSAECDLKLSLVDKGVLNAMTFAGMMTSAIVWGYVADTRGRRKILAYGYLIVGICGIGAALSQSLMQLMIFKYIGGFIISGPFAVLMSYLSELHGKQYRARVMMLNGMIFSFAKLMLPVMAIIILPQNWTWYIFGLTFHPWQIFLAVCAIPGFLCGSFFILFPESPKFLMSQGRNKEALEVFRTIYAINKHKPKDTYPIEELVQEIPDKPEENITPAAIEEMTGNDQKLRQSGAIIALKEGFNHMIPLLRKPYLQLSLQVCLMKFLIHIGQNTVRLWLPQLFASTTEFELKSTGPTSMCSILEYSVNKTTIAKSFDDDYTCEVVVTAASYTSNLIVGVTTIVMYALVGSLINVVGGKTILSKYVILEPFQRTPKIRAHAFFIMGIVVIVLALAGTSSIGLYFSISALMTLIFSASFVTMGSIANTALTNASVNLFPTSLRTMIVALNMVFGRMGSILGNILFPMFITMGCIPPFLMITSVMFFACILSTFLPSIKKNSLK